MRAGLTLPARNIAGSRVRVVAPVLRGGLVREDFVEGHVVPIDAVTRNYRNDRWVHAQVTDQRGHGDVQDVVAEASAIGPTAGDNSAAESRLNRTREHVAAEDAQTREAHVVLIGRMIRTTARQPARACAELRLNAAGRSVAGAVPATGFGRLER